MSTKKNATITLSANQLKIIEQALESFIDNHSAADLPTGSLEHYRSILDKFVRARERIIEKKVLRNSGMAQEPFDY